MNKPLFLSEAAQTVILGFKGQDPFAFKNTKSAVQS
jgi:hypothetical protein